MAKEISLTQGKMTLVDDEDFDELNKHKWYAHRNDKTGKFYAERTVGVLPFRRIIKMHRQIMNAPKGVLVDHIREQDTLDNRKSNLRLCTNSENMCNREKTRNNKSGFKGVTFHLRMNKWKASIGLNGKYIHIGYYHTAEEAARSYDKKAIELHGKFAKLNFPKGSRRVTNLCPPKMK